MRVHIRSDFATAPAVGAVEQAAADHHRADLRVHRLREVFGRLRVQHAS
jgi:hypothetical protein